VVLKNPEEILAPDALEERRARMDAYRLGVDDAWARETSVRLQALGVKLAAGSAPLAQALGAYAQAWSDEIALRGAVACAMPGTPWAFPRNLPTPETQGARDAMLLAAAFPGDAQVRFLASRVAYLCEEDIADYALEVLFTALLDAANYGHAMDGVGVSLARAVELEERVAQAARGSGDVPRFYVVREGDTLRDVAMVMFGSEDAWTDVAARFGLYPPYVSDTFRPGCLSPGMRLALPAEASLTRDRLGVTLALDVEAAGHEQHWDFALRPEGGLELARGLDGVGSDLALRVMTPRGSLRGLPDYGAPRVAGLPADEAGLVQALLTSDALLEDRRVAQVIPAARAATSAVSGIVVQNVVAVVRPELLTG